jgi:hypothetical protein
VVLRAVGLNIRAAGMLYDAADLLTPGRNAEARAFNAGVVALTTRLLDITDAGPELIEAVLRSLPDLENDQPERERTT